MKVTLELCRVIIQSDGKLQDIEVNKANALANEVEIAKCLDNLQFCKKFHEYFYELEHLMMTDDCLALSWQTMTEIDHFAYAVKLTIDFKNLAKKFEWLEPKWVEQENARDALVKLRQEVRAHLDSDTEYIEQLESAKKGLINDLREAES